jgi:predicted Zn-dependent protease
MIQRIVTSLRRLSNLSRAALFFLVVAAAPGCETNPITGRSSFNIVSEDQANQMGVEAFQQILQEEKVSTDPQANALVEEVGRRIAAVTDRHMKEEGREPFEWEFKVIDNPETINAFCLPGGKVAFYTGILPICKDANGVAVVMGHEIGHAYAKHGAGRVSTGLLGQVTLEAVSAALTSEFSSDTAQLATAALGAGFAVGVQLPFSRADEADADRTGLMLMAEAGYDPREAVAFWQRMQQATGGSSAPTFLSTHPGTEDRIADLQEHIPRALEVHERSKAGGGPN